jgi:hypothetical protein
MKAADLKPGDVLMRTTDVGKDDPRVTILVRRKTGASAEPWPGWWCVGLGGLADWVAEEQWVHVGHIGIEALAVLTKSERRR